MPSLLKKNAFTAWIVVAVVAAILVPGPAAKGGFLQTEWTTQLGVWLIFLFQGLSLPTSELKAGYKPMRLHAFVLLWNYVLFALVAACLLIPLGTILREDLVLGFWLLAILPTTVSSAVTFTAVAGGRTANAIFSTVFSNLLAVLLVPTVAVAYLSAGAGVSVPLLPLFAKLGCLIVLPLLVGQAIRRGFPARAAQVGRYGKSASNGIIVFIVHAAFAESVRSGFLEGLSAASVVMVIFGTAVLLLAVHYAVWKSSAWAGLDLRARVTALFCGSQKSIATGLPLATSILLAAPGQVDAAAVLIPLMCYHPLQLLLAGWLSGYLQRLLGPGATRAEG